MQRRNRTTRNLLLFSIVSLMNYTVNAQISVYDCAVPLDVENTDINPSPTYLFEAPCIEFKEAINFNHPAGANKDFKASKQISVGKNFRVGNDGSSQFILRVDEPELDVVAFDVTSLNGIPKFDKFEVGIEIPSSVQAGIDAFLIDETSTGALNPYMDWDIEVEAVFTHSATGTTMKKHGFYFEEFERVVYDSTVTHTSDGIPIFGTDGKVTYYGYKEWGGRWDSIPTSHPFRIRFAPSELGVWDCSINLVVNEGVEVFSYNSFRFNVVPSDNKGFVEVGDNNRFFKRGNETFMPFGPNLAWPSTDPALDPEDYSLLGNNSEKYRYGTAPLKTFMNFENRVIELAGTGANNFRYIMAPWAGDIEYEKLGNYTDRLNIAWEIDRMISISNSLDLNIDFNMLVQYNLEYAPYGIRPWDWEDGTHYLRKVATDSVLIDSTGLYEYTEFHPNLSEPAPVDVNDVIPYCYSRVESGGIKPEQFLDHPVAIKYYKQRLRYIIARWGYATNITNWELFSEIDGIGGGNFRGNIYRGTSSGDMLPTPEFLPAYTPLDVQQKVEDWHKAMSDYVKIVLKDPHLISPSYAGRVYPNDQSYNLNSIDIKSENLYNHSRVLNFAHAITDPIIDPEFYPGGLRRIEWLSTQQKPIIFSEHGLMGGVFDCDDGLEFKRTLWMTTFVGTAMANAWNVWHRPEYWNEYGKILTFLGGQNFDAEDWNPGHSIGGRDMMESWNRKADMTYLRSNDGLRAMGVINNRTNNFHTQYTGPISYEIVCDDLDPSHLWATDADIYDNYSPRYNATSNLRVMLSPVG